MNLSEGILGRPTSIIEYSTFSNYEIDGTEWGTKASYSRTIHPSRNILIFMLKSGQLCLDNHLMILASSCSGVNLKLEK